MKGRKQGQAVAGLMTWSFPGPGPGSGVYKRAAEVLSWLLSSNEQYNYWYRASPAV